MSMDDIKKWSMILTMVLTIGGALGGLYNFGYDAGFKVGSAETKSDSLTSLMHATTVCDDRVSELRDKLFECRTSR